MVLGVMAIARRFMSRFLRARARMRLDEMCAWRPHWWGARVYDALGLQQQHLAARVGNHVDVQGLHAACIAVGEQGPGVEQLQDCGFAPGVCNLNADAAGQDDAEVLVRLPDLMIRSPRSNLIFEAPRQGSMGSNSSCDIPENRSGDIAT